MLAFYLIPTQLTRTALSCIYQTQQTAQCRTSTRQQVLSAELMVLGVKQLKFE